LSLSLSLSLFLFLTLTLTLSLYQTNLHPVQENHHHMTSSRTQSTGVPKKQPVQTTTE